ncbi:MAG: ABC transporter permease [SAR202 cluster bacterium]|nr:ABC transporter permease [SAR202 cluster bacterium]
MPGRGRALAELAAGWLPAAGLGLGALMVWEAAVRIFDVPRWLLPPPSRILWEIFTTAELLGRHTWITVQEVLIGFCLATSVGVVLAVLLAYSRALERSLYPYVIASQTVPIIAIAPLLLVWVGPGQASKVIIVALISFFPIVVNVVDGLRSADSEMIAMFRTLGASKRQIFQKLQVPSALPYFLSGLKVAAVVAVIGAVIGEWVGARGGLGWLMRISAPQFQTSRVFAAIFILSALGICLFLLVGALEKVALRHYPNSDR